MACRQLSRQEPRSAGARGVTRGARSCTALRPVTALLRRHFPDTRPCPCAFCAGLHVPRPAIPRVPGRILPPSRRRGRRASVERRARRRCDTDASSGLRGAPCHGPSRLPRSLSPRRKRLSNTSPSRSETSAMSTPLCSVVARRAGPSSKSSAAPSTPPAPGSSTPPGPSSTLSSGRCRRPSAAPFQRRRRTRRRRGPRRPARCADYASLSASRPSSRRLSTHCHAAFIRPNRLCLPRTAPQ